MIRAWLLPLLASFTWACAGEQFELVHRGEASRHSIDASGRFIAFSSRSDPITGAARQRSDVWLLDRTTRTYTNLSDMRGNGASRPALSGSGRYVVFTVDLASGSEVLWLDRSTGATDAVSTALSDAVSARNGNHAVSDDGRYVVFFAQLPNADPFEPGIETVVPVLFDRASRRTVRLAAPAEHPTRRDPIEPPVISDDGRVVAFTTRTAVLPDDVNGTGSDIYAYVVGSGQTQLISCGATGAGGNGDSYRPAIASDGRSVAFVSQSTTGIPQPGRSGHIHVKDRLLGGVMTIDTGGAGLESTNPASLDIDRIGRFVTFAPRTSGVGQTVDSAFVWDRNLDAVTRIDPPEGTTSQFYAWE
ncbi:MAG: PD40 domain-containing protein, partial [Planctomycetes bacterium]|nr:PD40 domain-containing protein [Planctomycetota bacterium]